MRNRTDMQIVWQKIFQVCVGVITCFMCFIPLNGEESQTSHDNAEFSEKMKLADDFVDRLPLKDRTLRLLEARHQSMTEMAVKMLPRHTSVIQANSKLDFSEEWKRYRESLIRVLASEYSQTELKTMLARAENETWQKQYMESDKFKEIADKADMQSVKKRVKELLDEGKKLEKMRIDHSPSPSNAS